MRIYTDGACRKGVGGWGWWNQDTDEVGSAHVIGTTNQRMELMAAFDAISLYYDEPQLTIVSDSAYLVNCFKERWYLNWFLNGWKGSNGKPVANRDIWEPLLDMVLDHPNIRFEWVKGHNGDEGNEKADFLAASEVVRAAKAQREAG
jgi:ribonuclease HI